MISKGLNAAAKETLVSLQADWTRGCLEKVHKQISKCAKEDFDFHPPDTNLLGAKQAVKRLQCLAYQEIIMSGYDTVH